MKLSKVRVSLRYKLLAVLVTLPLISLTLYLGMATELFQKDKIAYVFDSSATVSRSLATQTRVELQSAYISMRNIAENFDFSSSTFGSFAQDLFKHNDRIIAFVFFSHQADGQYRELGQLVKDDAQAQAFVTSEQRLARIRQVAVDHAAFLSEISEAKGYVAMAFRLGEKVDPRHLVVISLYKSDDLVNAYDMGGTYASFMVNRSGDIALGGFDVIGSDLQSFKDMLKTQVNEGTAEARLADGQIYLVSYANVGIGDLVTMSRANKARALKAVDVLLLKSLLFFIALIASTVLISVFASNQLTATLRDLFEATRKIAQGNFDVRVQARSRDEVGSLAENFNWMAAEMSRLLNETAEKVRMEGELHTVKTVQETLFPESDAQFGPLHIRGHFEPASECGGDWWSYSRVGNRIYVYIGDATGHGAPAALITSAACSAAAVIESMPHVTPGQALTILNRAIHQTSKGQIMMTFFVACFDLDENILTYASASHDPPYLLRRHGDKFVKKDLLPLNEVNGPRLGDKKDFTYKDFAMGIESGDLLFFYTDGILDIQAPDGKKWGERAFLKTLVDSANAPSDVSGKVDILREQVSEFRNGAELIDDVTMVMCEFEKRAA